MPTGSEENGGLSQIGELNAGSQSPVKGAWESRLWLRSFTDSSSITVSTKSSPKPPL